tara:strand:+ start:621 stop:1073 length:453 start_codon:yes stop_codon:yes gene_type:complete
MQQNIKKYIYVLLIISFPISASCEEIFLSLKKNKVNVRYGPSFESPVKFIYKKINLPVKLIDKKENWRRIIDLKNNSGWIHNSQLKNSNSLIPLSDTVLFKKPSFFSEPIAKIEKGRVLVVNKCNDNWCKIKSQSYKGWISKENVWGSSN